MRHVCNQLVLCVSSSLSARNLLLWLKAAGYNVQCTEKDSINQLLMFDINTNHPNLEFVNHLLHSFILSILIHSSLTTKKFIYFNPYSFPNQNIQFPPFLSFLLLPLSLNFSSSTLVVMRVLLIFAGSAACWLNPPPW